MDMDPSDIPLPPILDPLLDYLADALPSPAYSFLVRFLSHALALVTAGVSLTSSLISSKPWEWDAQTVIPPLITFLAAYLALLSLYRTTSWMVRTLFWFLKWGSIFGFFVGFAGYIAGNQGGNDLGLGPSGIFGAVGGLLAELLNVPGTQRGGGGGGGARNRNGVGGNYAPRQSTRQTRSKSKAQRERKSRPKPWESFEEHRDWQYRENAAADDQGDAAQQIISDIAGAATKVLLDGGWWDTAKGLFAGRNSGNGDADPDTQENEGSRSSRSR